MSLAGRRPRVPGASPPRECLARRRRVLASLLLDAVTPRLKPPLYATVVALHERELDECGISAGPGTLHTIPGYVRGVRQVVPGRNRIDPLGSHCSAAGLGRHAVAALVREPLQ